MESVLRSIPGVVVYIDDNLIDDTYQVSSKGVKTLIQAGLCLKKGNVSFAPSGIYQGLL